MDRMDRFQVKLTQVQHDEVSLPEDMINEIMTYLGEEYLREWKSQVSKVHAEMADLIKITSCFHRACQEDGCLHVSILLKNGSVHGPVVRDICASVGFRHMTPEFKSFWQDHDIVTKISTFVQRREQHSWMGIADLPKNYW